MDKANKSKLGLVSLIQHNQIDRTNRDKAVLLYITLCTRLLVSESNCTTKSEKKKMEMLYSSANFLLKFSLHKIPKFMRDAVRAITVEVGINATC